jgi:hypothetical protein
VRLRALALVCVALAASAASGADLRRVEATGTVPVAGSAATTSTARTVAVRAAVARAVESVAQDLGADVPKPPPPAGATDKPKPGKPRNPAAISPELAKALGDDPLEYATRYRILEDKGVRAVPEPQPGQPEREYVVIVEVQVDATRVGERLRAAGWLASAGDGRPDTTTELVLEGLNDYRALASVRRLLVEKLGARKVLPVEFRRGQAVLSVEGGPPAGNLAAALQAAAPPELRLVPVESDDQGVTLVVEWTPPPTAPVEPAAGNVEPD